MKNDWISLEFSSSLILNQKSTTYNLHDSSSFLNWSCNCCIMAICACISLLICIGSILKIYKRLDKTDSVLIDSINVLNNEA